MATRRVNDLRSLLREQVAYYRARAAEYDRVYEDAEQHTVRAALADQLPIGGDVLELACGTGQWTELIARRARTVTAVDASPEMISLARDRVGDLPVRFVEADLFTWRPARRFDTVFFAFWLSHVPPKRFAPFWSMVREALAPKGQAVFVDNGPGERASEEVLGGQPAPMVRRRLVDGSEHRVVKVFYDPGVLQTKLTSHGWMASVWPVGTRFLAGIAVPADAC